MQSLTNNKNVIERADKIQPSLKDPNSAFSTVHCAISHRTKLSSQNGSRNRQKHVNTQKNVPIQNHSKAAHIRETLQSTHKKRVALGLMGEKGTEQSPNDFINRKRQGARNQKRSIQIIPHTGLPTWIGPK